MNPAAAIDLPRLLRASPNNDIGEQILSVQFNLNIFDRRKVLNAAK